MFIISKNNKRRNIFPFLFEQIFIGYIPHWKLCVRHSAKAMNKTDTSKGAQSLVDRGRRKVGTPRMNNYRSTVMVMIKNILGIREHGKST